MAQELSSTHDVNSMLETITRRAGVAVRAPRYLLVAQLPGDTTPRIHHVGFTEQEAEAAAREILQCDPDALDGSRLVVDIGSARGHFGRLAAFYPEQYRFLPQERSLLMAYAGHAAAALETAAALDESRDRNTTLSALLALGKVLAEESDKGEVAQRLADALPEIVRCEQADVFLWDGGDAVLARLASTAPSGTGSAGPTAGGRPPGWAWPTGCSRSPRRRSCRQRRTPSCPPILTVTGLASGVLVPITARSTLFGVIVVGPDSHELQGDATMRERLSGVASLAATALEGLALLDEVRHQALHDPVTDLANSRLFEDRVTQSLSIARRNGGRFALLFVDLDRFKAVNDTHGHKVGDELLRAVAERLLATVRNEDTVARIGGDEFGILVRGASGRPTPRWWRRRSSRPWRSRSSSAISPSLSGPAWASRCSPTPVTPTTRWCRGPTPPCTRPRPRAAVGSRSLDRRPPHHPPSESCRLRRLRRPALPLGQNRTARAVGHDRPA